MGSFTTSAVQFTSKPKPLSFEHSTPISQCVQVWDAQMDQTTKRSSLSSGTCKSTKRQKERHADNSVFFSANTTSTQPFSHVRQRYQKFLNPADQDSSLTKHQRGRGGKIRKTNGRSSPFFFSTNEHRRELGKISLKDTRSRKARSALGLLKHRHRRLCVATPSQICSLSSQPHFLQETSNLCLRRDYQRDNEQTRPIHPLKTRLKQQHFSHCTAKQEGT